MNALLVLFLAVVSPTCEIVDPSFGPQYITYERHNVARPDYGNESIERVWFRFHNNTTCRLTVPAAMPLAFRRLPDNTPTTDPVDGQEVALDVHITNPGTRELYVHPGGDLRSESSLPARQSIIFSVAANLLKRGPIAIRFSYQWERPGAPGFGEIEHRLVFDPTKDLDEDVRRWLDKVEDPPKRPFLSAEFPGRRLSGAPACEPGPAPEDPR
jgi:hypothetical protein